MHKFFSILLKFSIVLCSLGGVALSLSQAVNDGFSSWFKRLFYFTAFSNLALGFTFFLLFFFALFNKNIPKTLFLCRYIFTVCICVTLLVFCFILSPFADPNYKLRSLSSFLTHFLSPALAIVDFFLFPSHFSIQKQHRFLCLLPPLFYSTFAVALSFLSVDFGRGDNFPYPFINPLSPARFFGFSKELPFTGTFYWLIFLALIVYMISCIFCLFHNKNIKKKQGE